MPATTAAAAAVVSIYHQVAGGSVSSFQLALILGANLSLSPPQQIGGKRNFNEETMSFSASFSLSFKREEGSHLHLNIIRTSARDDAGPVSIPRFSADSRDDNIRFSHNAMVMATL